MSTDSASFFDAALSLPDDERANLAFQLLQSLQPPAVIDESDASFAEEIERRAEDFESGKAGTSSWEDVAGRVRRAGCEEEVMRLRIHDAAEIELRAAALYYEERQSGLGRDFYERVAQCMEAISREPLRFSRYEALRSKREFRRAFVERFPYLIVYQVFAEEIVVIAVAHSSRRPGYWQKRT